MWDKFVIDASMGCRDGLLWFCPVEMDESGQITSIVTGMNYVGAPPDGAEVIGVVHEDGQDAAEDFSAQYEPEISAFLAARTKGD